MYNLVHSIDSLGFSYADLKRDFNGRVGDGIEIECHRSTVTSICNFTEQRKAVSALLSANKLYKKLNCLTDSAFITRRARKKELNNGSQYTSYSQEACSR